MARVSLKPGQTSISNVAVSGPNANGELYMQWWAVLPNGRKVKRQTRGKCSVTELRRRAEAQAKTLMATYAAPKDLSLTSPLSDYIYGTTIPFIESKTDDELRPNSRARYVHVLDLFARQMKGFSIEDAMQEEQIEAALKAIALQNGTATAKQTRKVVHKYVGRRLHKAHLFGANPMDDLEITLPQHAARQKPKGGQALSPEQRQQVIEHLLKMDPAKGIEEHKQGRWSLADRIAVRANIIDMTLLGAATGMRITEIRKLTQADVTEENGRVMVCITPEVSKTKKGRRIPLLDARVGQRLKSRLETIGNSPNALVFSSPSNPNKVWDLRNAERAAKRLYMQLADELDIPLLSETLTHVWRATISTEMMNAGVPVEVRAAYLGQSPEVNTTFYTDTTDMSSVLVIAKSFAAANQ